MRISGVVVDRIYGLEAGRPRSTGPPGTVRNNPLVIASYLGTDEQDTARSAEEPARTDRQ